MGSEWPDKHDKTGFGSMARGGEDFFCVVTHPILTKWAMGWFELQDCSSYDMMQ